MPQNYERYNTFPKWSRSVFRGTLQIFKSWMTEPKATGQAVWDGLQLHPTERGKLQGRTLQARLRNDTEALPTRERVELSPEAQRGL